MSPLVQMTRRVVFSSGHRYWRHDLSDEANRKLFGEWASPYNHGHNYTLEVTVEGTVDPRTGMVVNIKRIDDVLKEVVLGPCDGRSLNDEVPYFTERAPTVENILRFCRQAIEPQLPGECILTALKLEETPTLYGELAAHSNMITITRVYEFAAAHRLHSEALTSQENLDLFGKCNNPAGHGHNYVLEVTVAGQPDNQTGMLVDIDKLDEAVNREVVDRYDHKHLNVDVPEFKEKPASSEYIVAEIFERLKDSVPARLTRVRLWETARNIFTIEAA